DERTGLVSTTTTTTGVATPDGAMDLYEAAPDGATLEREPRGAIIVVQEAFGVNDHIQDVTRRFASAGYHAAAPAFFHRAGGGTAAAGGLPFPPLIGESSSLQTPWLGLFGDLDKGISVESVEELRAALGAAPVDAEIVRYADAEHGFHCDARESYHAESAAD